MVGINSVKSKNIADSPSVSLHWQVSEETSFDSFIIWGQAKLFTNIETKTSLWSGVFDYDLNVFAPHGPENSPENGFISVKPTKAVLLKEMGIGARLIIVTPNPLTYLLVPLTEIGRRLYSRALSRRDP